MAGKKIDPVSEAALEVVEMDRRKEELAKQAQANREQMIAQCHEVIGRVQANNLMSKFGNVASLVYLQQVKESKAYHDLPNVGTWDKFCEYIGLSRRKVDEDLQNLAAFGEDFLATCRQLSVGYRDLRKLRQLTHDGSVTIDAEYMVIGEERIPIDADHKEDLQAAIENIIEQQASLKAEVEAQKKAFDRVQKETHQSTIKLQKELDKLTAQAEAKGLTPEEDAFIQDCDNARITITSFLDRFDPSINPLPEDATPRMQATLMHTLAWFKRCIQSSYDTAGDLYGLPEMDGGWMPPHLREVEAVPMPTECQLCRSAHPPCSGCCKVCHEKCNGAQACSLEV